MPKTRSYSGYTKDAATLLGRMIKLQRKSRRWTAADLAERIGVSLVTLRRIENGEPTCAIGLVFEAATIVGVPLFDSDQTPLATNLDRVSETLALMPQKIRKNDEDFDDDF